MVAVGNGGQPGRVAATALPVLAAVRLGNDSALVGWGLAAGTLGFLPVAVQGIVYVRVPTGQPQSSRGRVLEVVIIAGTVLVLVGGLLRSDLSDTAPGRTDGISHPLTGGTVIGSIADAITVAAPLVVLAGLLAGLGVVGRFRRADGIERQQLKWLSVGVIASLALFPFAVAEVSWLSLIDIFGSLLFVVTLAIPVLRYRLWSIDTIVRRSLAYGTVSALLALVYVGVAAVGASVVSQRVGTATAAIVIAVAFAPLGSRVQRVVDRVAYGDRSDPYRTIERARPAPRRRCRTRGIAAGHGHDARNVIATALRSDRERERWHPSRRPRHLHRSRRTVAAGARGDGRRFSHCGAAPW